MILLPRRMAISVLLLGMAVPALGQGTQADYDRADALAGRTSGTVFNATLRPHWSADGDTFWYRSDGPDGVKRYIWVDAVRGTRVPAFDHARVAAELERLTGRTAAADHLWVGRITAGRSPGDRTLVIQGRRYSWDAATGRLAANDNASEGTDATSDSLPAFAQPGRSDNGGEEATITFVNRTSGGIDLFWIDAGGERHPYGSVDRGDRRVMHTFARHNWLVTAKDGRVLANFRADEAGGDAIVTDSLTLKPGPPRNGDDNDPPQDRPTDDGDRLRPAQGEQRSPDGKYRFSTRGQNVVVRDLESNKEIVLADNGSPGDWYRRDVLWSPDSKYLLVIRQKNGVDHKVHFVESSPPDQVQPRLHTIDYRKPGDAIDVLTPVLFDVTARKQIPIQNDLFSTPWSLDEFRWDLDSSRFTFVYNQRGHQVMRLLAVDAKTGSVSTVVNETSETFINYSGKFYLHWISDAELIWASERTGWNHLYLYDAKAGRVKHQITRGEWPVRGVDRVDNAGRQLWFQLSGIDAKQDPYQVHFARINFDGTGFTRLTEADGTHRIDYSPDRRFYIDRYSRVDLPPVHELRRASDGKTVVKLETADVSRLLGTGLRLPERFHAQGRDGRTDIWGVIYRPTNFDESKKYPVLEDIYAGPTDAFVPKAFHAFFGDQALAELGFVVVQIDGMGTDHRGKAFHDVCWKNLGDAGLPDRIAWIKAAAAKYPQLDAARVGIFGTSAGGQSALGALLFHGDFYKAAVASCGCHDNRMDKIWWNEQWMGWPVDDSYAASSNVVHAKNLTGKLLLIVGEVDDNVDPASTMQVVDALVKADKDFDLLVLPGQGHTSGGAYGERRRRDFFVRNLLGVEPRGNSGSGSANSRER